MFACTCSLIDVPDPLNPCQVPSALSLLLAILTKVVTKACGGALKSCTTPPTPIQRSRRSNEILQDEYDFIVVGGGTSGSIIAGRLANSSSPPWTVLLLEAGIEEPIQSQIPFLFPTYKEHPDLVWKHTTTTGEQIYRSKVLGGTSATNDLVYLRGTPHDYNIIWNNESNWRYESVLAYFKKAEGNVGFNTANNSYYHSSTGPITISNHTYVSEFGRRLSAAAFERGIPIVEDLNGPETTGCTIAQSTVQNGTRISTATAYLRHQSNRLTVLLNSTVIGFDFDDPAAAQKVIRYVRFVGDHQFAGSTVNVTHTVRARKEVILAAGPFNSPHILFRSGIGPRHMLQKHFRYQSVHHMPGVGFNLHDQISVPIKWQARVRSPRTNINDTLNSYIRHRNGSLSSSILAQHIIRFNTNEPHSRTKQPNIQLMFGGTSVNCAPNNRNGTAAPTLLSSRAVLLHPQVRGRLLIQTSSVHDMPMVYFKPNKYADDMKTLMEGMQWLHFIFSGYNLEGDKLAVYRHQYPQCEQFIRSSYAYWRCVIYKYVRGENEYGGTCKMGPEADPMAVVDYNFKVYGISNLRIADASIVPAPLSAGLYATLTMIGEKAADDIMTEWMDK